MAYRYNPFTNTMDFVKCPPNYVEITGDDSPYTVVRPSSGETVIIVDEEGGSPAKDVVIILYDTLPLDKITIKKNGSDTYKVTYQADDIDGQSSRELLSQYETANLLGETGKWGKE